VELHQKGLKNTNVKTMMFFIVELGFPVTIIIVGYETNQSPSHGASSRIFNLHHSSPFGLHAIVIYPP
jgi:hypothetical protein